MTTLHKIRNAYKDCRTGEITGNEFFDILEDLLNHTPPKEESKDIDHLDPDLQLEMTGKVLTAVANKLDEVIEKVNSLNRGKK